MGMTSILRVKVRWSGFQGAPGYSNFHFRDFGAPGGWEPGVAEAQACVAKTKTFMDALGLSNFPNGLQLAVQSDVEEIEDTTGALVDIHATTPVATYTSSIAAASYSASSGAVINWRTAVVRKNRRVRGKTFLVPLAGNRYENNGTLTAGTITDISNACTNFIADGVAPDLGVYARPTPVLDADGKPTGDYLPDGEWALVRSFNVPDMAAVLRSRRD